ncbi:Peptide-N4-(N-acetyl-beta-glucosaminyl)asparagine amidase A protein [Dioscorea alata]|uniref:Peptide-N4-(N-acetyl-beta-glucosaminyl)asparagine amidase A protein n=1 Tax=Dioscorea alata TaxID=55571 RepID=A0ACB7VFZ1_DIOAL|nr:Peptide-N4-(N-acetyl-beta-glucosaminyl)asparagine amidase A protein [Dioscorea alata]
MNFSMSYLPVISLLIMFSSAGGFPHPAPPAAPENITLEYIDPTFPPFPEQSPKCSLQLLQHDFADTTGAPPVSTNYTPPLDCPAPWSRVVLELSGIASDIQQDRIASIWLDGAEILRTTTPLPMYPGVHWQVNKDITKYTSLLRSSPAGSLFSMILENSNSSFPGIYSINVTLHYFRGALCDDTPTISIQSQACNQLSSHANVKELYRKPADMIIPISNEAGDCCSGGYWLKIHNETDVQKTIVSVPGNAYRAVMEIYVTAHADDQYWYANPLRSVPIDTKDPLSSAKANGGFRQVVLTIDGKYAGAVVPFPIIYPSSVNPYFWSPVTAIAAYNIPSYELNLTPLMSMLLNGREHEFGLKVRDAQPHWRVTANLHVWLDAWSDGVEAGLLQYRVPPLKINRQAYWKEKDGKSEVDGQVIVRFAGWVSSSAGNITTSVRERLKFKSHVMVQGRGTMKQVAMESKVRMNVRVEKERTVIGRMVMNMEAPLEIMTLSSNGGGGSVFERTKMNHGLEEMKSVVRGKEVVVSMVSDRQDSEGSCLMEEGMAVWGSGDSRSVYKYRDDKVCYLRSLNVVGGRIMDDVATPSCVALADE